MGDEDPEQWGDECEAEDAEQEKRQVRIWKATRHWPRVQLAPAGPVTIWTWLLMVGAAIFIWFAILVALIGAGS